MESTLDFIQRLMQCVPELEPIYAEHLSDNDCPLPHVLMGDISRFVVDQSLRDPVPKSVDQILRFLEEGLQSNDANVNELIGVSFIENIATEADSLSVMLPRMGELLTNEVRAVMEAR